MHLSTTLALAAAASVSAQSITCATGVHVIVARASGEAPGEGIIGEVAKNVTAAIPGSDSIPVPYPATFGDYFASETYGVGNMTNVITSYVDACPDAKLVLLGYSQGAQVLLDTLCGQSEVIFQDKNAPLADKYAKAVVAAVQMGDPSFIPGLAYDKGNATTERGIFPRSNTAPCLAYSNRLRSYCDAGDTYCASGNSSLIHISYVIKYGSEAVDFIVGLSKAALAGSGSGSSSSASASATATASASGTASTSAMSSAASALSSALSSAAAGTTTGGMMVQTALPTASATGAARSVTGSGPPVATGAATKQGVAIAGLVGAVAALHFL
jgi:acetylxylan esterase